MTVFFTAIGILCGICGILALLLVVADRYLNDYGTCRISINDDSRVLEVAGGESLLGTLGREKIFIPSACGGRGSCGLCKLKIHQGAPPVLSTEEPHLTPEEKKENIRLSCQIKVRENMRIEIPDELFNIKEYQAVCESVEDLTHDIKRIRFKLEDPAAVSFTPGQYIQLECPAYKLTPEPVYRAYSIATDPADTNHIDLVIRLVPEGICTTWVFDYLEPGTRTKLNGPYGDFKLSQAGKEMIFIAGGSGMAPFLSILKQMEYADDPRKCTYFFGALTKKDLFCLDEMKAFEEKLPDFTFVPALSQPAEEDEWTGETGLITDVVARHYDDCSDTEAYLCGSPGMIDACLKVLTEHGLPEAGIFYDKFA